MQSAYLALSRTEDVLEASSILLDEAMANESVDVGGFYLYDTKRSVLQLLNTRNVSDEVARILKEYRPNSDKWKSSVLKKKKPVFTDYRRLVSRHAKNPYTRSLLLKENIRALAIIPFLHNGHVIATLDVGSRSKGAFSKETKTNLVDLVRDTGDTLHRIVASAERREASVSRERMMNVISDNLLKRQRE
ncbi:MAG: GAF domain-containing protein, partial [Candidatus Methanofastidiosa archaeon]|nr:GAF domain-containing protein [Candidatus Methanofastidiosa archaeon]